MEAIIDTRIKTALMLHGVLHGFCDYIDTGTAIMELNVAQNIMNRPGPIISDVTIYSEILQHLRLWPPLEDLVGVWVGTEDADNLGRVLGEPGGGHQGKRASCPSVKGELRN